jgi:uncharacterized protein (UPF0333 family)
MVVVAIAIFSLVWFYVNITTTQTDTDLGISYARVAVDKIKQAADLVYTYGPPAKTNINIYIPKNVVAISFNSSNSLSEIIFKIRTGNGVSDIFAVSIANITGNLPTKEGYYEISIESFEGFVNVSY